MDLNDVLRKVRALVARAEHPETPEAEAKAASEMADALMLKYAIDEATIDKGRPEAQRSKPSSIDVALTGDNTLIAYMGFLAEQVAKHCNCLIRTYRHYDYTEHTWMARVYGFESDLRWFEIMYTTLRLHMVGALRPKIDPALSMGENAYNLHHAGQNWQEIAHLAGWRGPVTSRPGEASCMYEHEATGERRSYAQAVLQYKKAYQAEVRKRGEEGVRIPPAGGETFRRSSAEGYARRIEQRLREMREHRQIGSALALRVDLVSQFFRDDNPDLFNVVVVNTSGKKQRAVKYTPRPFSQSAYDVGRRHANGANLNPAASHNPPKEVR